MPRKPAAPASLSADEVEVSAFRQILIWPLVVAAERRSEVSSIVGNLLNPNSPWREEVQLFDHLPPLDRTDTARSAEIYAEAVYFHDYVRRILYPAADEPLDERGLRLFRRDDIESVEVELSAGDPARTRLSVDRVSLYLAADSLFVLAVEVSHPPGAPLKLSHAMTFSDQFRRIYPPYFDGSADWRPGLFPTKVAWRAKGQWAEFANWNPADADQRPVLSEQALRWYETLPIAPHWAYLLPAGFTMGADIETRLSPALRQVVDERMPLMSFISLQGPGNPAVRLRRGDLIRLCEVDGFGSDPLPYDEGFLAGYEARRFYDRFRHRGSRYLLSGFGFTMLGSGGFFEGVLQTHFRRHYFHMGLLLQIEAGLYLGLSSRIAQASAGGTKGSAAEGAIRPGLIGITREFFQLTQRFRFTGVSNQVQPSELFDLWRGLLGNGRLHDELADELQAVSAFLQAEEQHAMAEEERKQTRAALHLNGIAIWLGVVAIAAALMNIDGADWADFAAHAAAGPTGWLLPTPALLLRTGLALSASSLFGFAATRLAVAPLARQARWLVGGLAIGSIICLLALVI